MKKINFLICYLILIANLTSCYTNIIDTGMDGFVEQSSDFNVPSFDEAIDLGLSVKWASYNIGASKPTDYGNYYAWGEVEPKMEYSENTYIGYDGDTYGTVYDVANVKWGPGWRLPTIDETIELVSKCKWEETEIDGIKGMNVIGPNGNSIFFPAAGRCIENRFEDVGQEGHYWQGTAIGYDGVENMYYYDLNTRFNGLTIRPVYEPCRLNSIDSLHLNGWDYGMTDGEKYVVYKTNLDKTITVCVAYHNDTHYSFILDIDEDTHKVIGFGTLDTYYHVNELDNEYMLSHWNHENIEIVSFPKKITTTKLTPQTRNPLVVAGFILCSYVALKNLYVLSKDLHEGRWDDFFNHIGLYSSDYIQGEQIGGGSVLVDLSNMRAEQLKAEQDGRNSQYIYGNANIRITGINEQEDESYIVHTEITGLSSVQSMITVLCEENVVHKSDTTDDSWNEKQMVLRECENNIFAGVLCREFYPPFIEHYTYCSSEVEVTNGNTNTKYLAFRLPPIKNKGKHIIKPYLRSSINNQFSNERMSYVKYGEPKEINIIGGKILWFKQADAKCIGNGDVKFVAYANAKIDSNEGLEDWGVYCVGNDGKYHRFSAAWPSSKTESEIRIEITIPRNEFDNIDYENFKASKSICFGVFTKQKNPQGVYDYLTYEYGAMNEYDLYYDKEVKLLISDVSVIANEPYSDDFGSDSRCSYQYTLEIYGCLFMDSLINHGNTGWAYEFSQTLADKCEDGYKRTISDAYTYHSEGSNKAMLYFAAVLGNGVYYALPPALCCGNGNVELSSSTRTKTFSTLLDTNDNLLMPAILLSNKNEHTTKSTNHVPYFVECP